MPPKRKNISSDQTSSHTQWKKQRREDARHISVQPVTSSSMEGVPSTIDVEKFAEARAFEIKAMQDAMKNASTASTHRVWQTLPRHLRRRAASHDVRRVPARLRQKAISEMDTATKVKKKKLPKRGKLKEQKRTEVLLKRQVDKSWLETHIWHAKRMHMENMWGYRLAVTPTEKSFRPSHRASVHGCILHDASYEAIIELKGPERILQDIVTLCSDPQCPSPGAARFIKGSRMSYTNFYRPNTYPFGLIGPVEVFWYPGTTKPTSPNTLSTSPTPDTHDTPTSLDSIPQHKVKVKKQKDEPVHQLWIKCHPLIYNDILSSLTYSVQLHLQKAQSAVTTITSTSSNAKKRSTGKERESTTSTNVQPIQQEIKVELADLRNQFNIFELMGPKSSQVIHGALVLANEKRPELKKFWNAFGQLQTAGSVPRGMIIGCKVLDPRLNFPPTNTKVKYENKDGPSSSTSSVLQPDILWPSSNLAMSEIWDEEARQKVVKPAFKKADIDKRKEKHLVPGTKLRPLRQDDRIPILLIQRSLEQNKFTSSTGTNTITPSNMNTHALHGWTLIIPKGWGMPFFSSLTHTGTRVAGQRERLSQHFEASIPSFPFDFPCTSAYFPLIDERGKEEKEKWERIPPAKRPSWTKLGTRSPYKPDWEVIVGIVERSDPVQSNDQKARKQNEDSDLVPTQRETIPEIDEAAKNENRMNIDQNQESPENENENSNEPNNLGSSQAMYPPWLLKGAESVQFIDQLSRSPIPALEFVQKINIWRSKRSIPALPTSIGTATSNNSATTTSAPPNPFTSALIPIRLIFPLSSGSPGYNAIIYKVTDDNEILKWVSLIQQRRHRQTKVECEPGVHESELSSQKCSEDAIIGYATSGNYSLSVGQSQAIGAISLTSYLEINEQQRRHSSTSSLPLVKLRNKDNTVYRVAFVELLS